MGQENTPSRTRRFSVQKPLKATSPRKQSKSPSRARWPELNVVTNFSKPPILAKRAANDGLRKTRDASVSTEDQRRDAKAIQSQSYHADGPDESRTYNGRFPRLGSKENDAGNDGLPDHNSQVIMKDAAGLEMQHLDQGGTSATGVNDIKGPIYDLKRAPSKRIELSPSDRLVAIGIIVTPTSLADRTMSPEDGRQTSPGLHVQPHAPSRGSPAAPSIVVTPAKEFSPWSSPSQQYFAYRPRPVSSVYSQAPYRSRAATHSSSTPPVPSLAKASRYLKQGNASEPVTSHNEKNSPSRVLSSCTVFEDDESPPAGTRDQVYPAEPQIRALARSSTDSIATKHRSQGWWNYLTSPFSAKPHGDFFFFKDSIDKAELSSPHSSEATKVGEDDEGRGPLKKDDNFPVTPISGGSYSSHTSIWTDTSGRGVDCGSIGLAFDHTPRASEIVRNWPREIVGTDLSNLPSSPEDLSPEGFGAAAEYYQACLHDQNSPTPYFECQNHTCLPVRHVDIADGRALGDDRALGDIVEESGDMTVSRSAQDPNSEDPALESPEKLKPAVFKQTPANRFSAAFKESNDRSASRQRPTSEDTIIEDVDTTPAIEEAHVAPVLRAAAPVQTPVAHDAAKGGQSSSNLESSPQPPSSLVNGVPASTKGLSRSSESRSLPAPEENQAAINPTPLAEQKNKASTPSIAEARPRKRFVAVLPPDHSQPVPEQSPQPQSTPPVKQRDLAAGSDVHTISEANPGNDHRPVYIVNHYHGNYRPPEQTEQVALTDFYPPPRPAPARNEKHEAELVKDRGSGSGKKLRGCLKLRKRSGTEKPKKKKKCLLIAIAIGLILLIILILALALTLTRKGDQMPVQSQWLNLTGFPPIPTGISTIIQPDASHEQSGCVSPTTLWSCALPKEEQAAVAPNDSDQPNFRVEIRFQNGTNASLGTNTSLSKRSERRASNPVSASSLVRRHLLQIRDSFSNSLFTPSPPPPSMEDQAFLGNSTDEITAPFAGEFTPFFMSFESAQKLPAARLFKRVSASNSSDSNSTDPFPDLTEGIPPPDNNPDGTAAAAALLPFPSAQPLRLFNRGLPTEHYGFYTYFDRSIFLKSTALLDNIQGTGEVPDDENGGAEESAATVRCTWAQTRFLVQIWTNKGGSATLLASTNSNVSSTGTGNQNPKNLTASSANDFTRPGSFPYPVSITLDRHGGDINTKMIYCYGMDERRHLLSDSQHKKVQLEDRAFGGHLVNPALGPFGHVNVSTSEGGPGGIDGGTGGCTCLWRNWNGVGG